MPGFSVDPRRGAAFSLVLAVIAWSVLPQKQQPARAGAALMKAVVQDAYGPAEVLQLRDVERPEAGENEVLVRVRAAGMAYGVWHLMAGKPYIMRLAFGLSAPCSRPGIDLAGRVEAVGPGVSRFQIGDDVFGQLDPFVGGAFAEYARVPADRLARKPRNLDFAQAAASVDSAVTALQALRDAGQLAAGQRVLVIGASGGVGSFAVQLARALGAGSVVGVCSTAKMDLVRSLGADRVIDYTQEDFTEADDRYDLIIDIAGNRPLDRLRRALTPDGTLVIVGGEGGGDWFGLGRQIHAAVLDPFVKHTLRSPIVDVNPADLEALRELLEAGQVAPAMDRTFPLAEVPDAVRYLVAGRVRGKISITVQP